MRKTYVNSKLVQVVGEDGLLRTQETSKTHVVHVEDTDKFFMIYYNMLKSFYQIKYLKDVMLLVKLASLADYDTGVVTVAVKTRELICEEIHVTKTNLSAMFGRLIELGLIFGSKGIYTINEGVFWKGESKTRRAFLKEEGLDFILRFKL